MFKLPEEVKKDIGKFKSSLEELNSGKITSLRFKGIRVPWGIYSHRGGKVFMSRVRIPAGIASPYQLLALAEAARRFAKGFLHITTRQDIQIHDVKIEDTVKIIEYLKDYDLSPRGGGGNTVRNVIACPLSGICEEEVFDVGGYASGITEYLLRQDTSFTLPRKFKISFSGCARDCVGALVNDLGFIAKLRDGKEGFEVFAGGGMGASPRTGKPLEDFLPQRELGFCVEAVKSVFYKKGDRRNKHHNRLRFLAEDMGFERFRDLYKQEFARLKRDEHIILRKIDYTVREEAASPIPRHEDAEYGIFLKHSVKTQKQKGFVSVGLRIPRGDISSKQLANLADLEKEFQGVEFRTSQDQNLIIAWVKTKDLYKLFTALKKILKPFLYPKTLLDIVACKGALTCNLGLCNSPGLAEELENLIEKDFIGKKVFKALEIKLNGCPNACGHQPVGILSFYGMVKRVGNRPVPFYKFLIGGKKEGVLTKFSEEAAVIPAKNIPEFLKRFLEETEKRLEEGTGIYEFLKGPAKGIIEALAEGFGYVPPYSENEDFYIDWGKKEVFSLEGLGQGECGAGILDMIEADLTEARLGLLEAAKVGFAADTIKKTILLSARALLVVKGRDPKTEESVFSDFKEIFVDSKIAFAGYSDINSVFSRITDNMSAREKDKTVSYAKEFLEEVNRIYKSMDSSFNFPLQEASASVGEKPTRLLDLRGTPCPINYVKTKLFLENLNSGDMLEVILDDGEPIQSVPKSLEADGHRIIKVEKPDGFYKITVRRK